MNIQFNKVSNVSGELTINMEKADYQPKVEKHSRTLPSRHKCPVSVKAKCPCLL